MLTHQDPIERWAQITELERKSPHHDLKKILQLSTIIFQNFRAGYFIYELLFKVRFPLVGVFFSVCPKMLSPDRTPSPRAEPTPSQAIIL